MAGILMIAVPILVSCGIVGLMLGLAFFLPRTSTSGAAASKLFVRARDLVVLAVMWSVAVSVFSVAFVIYAEQPNPELRFANLMLLAIPAVIAAIPLLIARSVFIGACAVSALVLTCCAVIAMWGFGPALLPAVIFLIAALAVESRRLHVLDKPSRGSLPAVV